MIHPSRKTHRPNDTTVILNLIQGPFFLWLPTERLRKWMLNQVQHDASI